MSKEKPEQIRYLTSEQLKKFGFPNHDNLPVSLIDPELKYPVMRSFLTSDRKSDRDLYVEVAISVKKVIGFRMPLEEFNNLNVFEGEEE